MNKFKTQNSKLKVKILSSLFIVLLLHCFITLLNFSSVNAQSVIPLIVAPARQSLEVDPGETKNFSVRFYNTGVDVISGTFQVANFIVDNNSGSPTFLDGVEELSPKYAAADWVSLNLDKGALSGNGMVTVNGTIKVPENATPGGKYFAVFFEPASSVPESTGSKQEDASSVSIRIAALIYLKVSGPISESASVVKFKVPSFSEYGPIIITTEIKNSGDYHITPVGLVTIKNMFGKEISSEELAETNIFPGVSRVFTNELGKKWMIGKYTATLSATYGDSGQSLTAAKNFWVLPWKLALIIILGISIIILVVVLITGKIVKKQKKLEEELIEEKEELAKLKERYEDRVSPPATSEPKSGTPEI